MRYYLLSGESSGDLHGAALIKNLQVQDAKAVFAGWGGELMQKQGMQLDQDYKQTAFMGVGEVLKNLWVIKSLFQKAKNNILTFQPDVVILIDYPGFNLRMAPWIKKNNFKLFYYISPKLWAWNSGRAKIIKKYVDEMFCILPFEAQFYSQYNIPIHYVGNPILDTIDSYKSENAFLKNNDITTQKPIIALLPGSRKQEIQKLLPIMTKMAGFFPDYHFLIAAVPTFSKEFYASHTTPFANCSLIFNNTYAVLQHAKAAIVTSGTATLETALFDVPQVVIYKTDFLFYYLGKLFIKVPFISLVNLIAEKKIVEELIQKNCNEQDLRQQLSNILTDAEQKRMKSAYQNLKNTIGEAGASEKAAKKIYSLLTQ